MDRTILQVPMQKSLREQAEATARFQGFSSLQEVVRIILKNLVKNELYLDVTTKEEHRFLHRHRHT